ncbi:MAG: hypothetical protein IIY28_04930, partial [Lachnospiraceae bacterium]|nr:hypothetical protein [Lachnospiraceae bacterium]
FRIPNIDAMKRRGNGSYSFGWNGDHEDLQWDSRGVRVRKLMEQDDKRSWVSFNRTWTDFYDALSGAAMELARKKPVKESAADTIRKWGTGDPKEPGLYVVIAGYPPKEADNNSMRAIKFWDGGGWYNDRTHAPFDLTVYRWYQLPEV